MATGLPSRQELLRSLQPISVANSGDRTRCDICHGDLADDPEMDNSERALRLHDNHFYGEHCIRRWLAENDSCPYCRKKVYRGSDYNIEQLLSLPRELRDDYVLDTERRAHRMVMRTPSVEAPIVDWDILNLLIRLSKAATIANSPEYRGAIGKASALLLEWRAQWWKRNPAYFTIPTFAPYTRVGSLSNEDLDTHIVVPEDPEFDDVIEALTGDSARGVSVTLDPYSVHVINHPLVFSAFQAILAQLSKDQGQTIEASILAVRLTDAIESDEHLESLIRGDRQDLPEGLKGFFVDVIVCVVRGFIVRWSVETFEFGDGL